MRSRLLSQSWALSVLMSRSIGFAGGTRVVPPAPWECLALILDAHGAGGRPRGGVDRLGRPGRKGAPLEFATESAPGIYPNRNDRDARGPRAPALRCIARRAHLL